MSPDNPGRSPIRIATDRLASAQYPAPVAIPSQHAKLDLESIATVLDTVHVDLERPIPVIRMKMFLPEIHPKRQFFHGIAQHGGIAGAVINIARLDIPIPHTILTGLHRSNKSLFTRLELSGFLADLFVQIAVEGDQLRRIAVIFQMQSHQIDGVLDKIQVGGKRRLVTGLQTQRTELLARSSQFDPASRFHAHAGTNAGAQGSLHARGKSGKTGQRTVRIGTIERAFETGAADEHTGQIGNPTHEHFHQTRFIGRRLKGTLQHQNPPQNGGIQGGKIMHHLAADPFARERYSCKKACGPI